MTPPLTTQGLSAAAAESLSWLGDHGFQYFKGRGHFRRKDENGFSYIAINSITHDRRAFHLAFYIGVQIAEVEAWVLRLMGKTREVTHDARPPVRVPVAQGSCNAAAQGRT